MSARLIALGVVSSATLAAAQPAPTPAPAPAAPAPQPQPAPAPAPAPSPPSGEDAATRDQRVKLNKQVENYDWEGGYRVEDGKPKIERTRGLFVGASFAYAPSSKIEVKTPTMEGMVEFPAVFGAELEAGYRIHPNFSAGLVTQMFLNLKPDEVDSAREVDVFAQATGHYAVAPKWDLNAFLAPGYSVLLVPGADDARGLAFRWGGGALYHFTDHIGLAAEISQQLGFQKTKRDGDNVDMKTSSVSLFGGIRFRL